MSAQLRIGYIVAGAPAREDLLRLAMDYVARACGLSVELRQEHMKSKSISRTDAVLLLTCPSCAVQLVSLSGRVVDLRALSFAEAAEELGRELLVTLRQTMLCPVGDPPGSPMRERLMVVITGPAQSAA